MIVWMMMLALDSVAPDARCVAPVEVDERPQVMIEDPDMAMKIAEIYLTKVYGAETMKGELPLSVSLHGNIWHLSGKALPRQNVGGVAEIDLCRSNGQVLRVVHGE